MFGRMKKYKQGLADALEATAPFHEKQQAALEELRKRVDSGQARIEDALLGLGDDLNGIYQYLSSREKAALYHLSTPMDIKDLDAEERQLLVAVLYQLAEDEGERLTDHQRAYIRSVQRYAEVTNPQTSADLDVVGDIDSLEVQKAFMQVTLEFLYLQDADELTEEQEDFFDNFSVNRKQAKAIEMSVSRLYNAVGPEGMAEKYGFVPEPEEDTRHEAVSDDREEITISAPVQISQGETVTYENKIVHIGGEITCNGTLRFENCRIHYAESFRNMGRILLGEHSGIDFSNCTIECHTYTAIQSDANFVESEDFEKEVVKSALIQIVNGKSASAKFTECVFMDCCQLLSGTEATVDRCQITNPGPALFYDIKTLTMTHTRVFLNEVPGYVPPRDSHSNYPHIICTENLRMAQCEASGTCGRGDNPLGRSAFIHTKGKIAFNDNGNDLDAIKTFSVENCLFHDTDLTLIQAPSGSSFSIRRCVFENCTQRYLCGTLQITNCRFDNCGVILSDGHSRLFSILANCQFNGNAEKGQELIFGRGDTVIVHSEFNNWTGGELSKSAKEEGGSNAAMIILEGGYITHFVGNCVFQAIHAEEMSILSGQASDKTKAPFIDMKDCKFIGCRTKRSEFVPRQCWYLAELFRGIIVYRFKQTPAISISNCTGLEDRNGETASQVHIVPRTSGQSPESVIGPTEPVGIPD